MECGNQNECHWEMRELFLFLLVALSVLHRVASGVVGWGDEGPEPQFQMASSSNPLVERFDGCHA